MKPIVGGVDKVTHPNARVNKQSHAHTSDKAPAYDDCDLGPSATNTIKGTSPMGNDKRHGLTGKRSQSRNQ